MIAAAPDVPRQRKKHRLNITHQHIKSKKSECKIFHAPAHKQGSTILGVHAEWDSRASIRPPCVTETQHVNPGTGAARNNQAGTNAHHAKSETVSGSRDEVRLQARHTRRFPLPRKSGRLHARPMQASGKPAYARNLRDHDGGRTGYSSNLPRMTTGNCKPNEQVGPSDA